jgi:phosphate/sulfate permease
MLNNLDPASALAIALLIFALIMVILFEATNGFHDAANVLEALAISPVLGFVLSGGLYLLCRKTLHLSRTRSNQIRFMTTTGISRAVLVW